MTNKTLPRPPQVTMAGWVTIVGSVFVVFTMFEAVAGLRSLDTQERVEQMLSEPPLEGTGIGVQDWLTIMQTVSMVAAACAAAAAILGWHVLQRSRSARLALSVVAVPMFLAGLVSAPFLTALVCVSAVMLWTRPARDWFNGIAPPEPVRKQRASDVPPAPAPPVSQPPPHPGFGTPPTTTQQGPQSPPPGQTQQAPWQAQQPPWQAQQPPWQAQQPWPAADDRRPSALVQACLATWITSGLVLLFSAGAAIVVLGSSEVIEQFRDQQSAQLEELGLGDGELQVMLATTFGVFAVWSLAALVLGWLVWAGHEWARILLIVSAVIAGLICLLGVTAVVPLLPAAVCAFVTSRLLRADVRAWVSRPRR